jgi:succinyl-CoA synthetase alpha subunit
MSIYIDEDTKVIVQGITGQHGSFHTKAMLDYGTKIVAGVTPGRGGEHINGVPVYDTMKAALSEHDADVSIVFVPSMFAKDAAFAALEYLDMVVVITECIPVHDSMKIKAFSELKGSRLIGPNTAGIISPGKCKVGIMPGMFFKEGEVGLVSRSGTLSYEIALALLEEGLGQSTLVGIGGDPVLGTSMSEVLREFEEDPETKAIVLIGEIGGEEEEKAAEVIKEMSKPVIGYIAGITAPEEKKMGHAGAIISRGKGTALSKINALKKAGATIAKFPYEIPRLVKNVI